MTIILLLTLLAVAALAALSSAQTEPPTYGDWVLGDSTTKTDLRIDIPGDLSIVDSGHLQLSGVDLRFQGQGAHYITVDSGARLTIAGGSISAPSGKVVISAHGQLIMMDTGVQNSDTIYVYSWGSRVTNTTITAPTGDGVNANPAGPYTGALVIADNRIISPTGHGVYVNVPLVPQPTTVAVVNNNITNAGVHGIYIISAPPTTSTQNTGHYFLQGNKVVLTGGHCIWVDLPVDFLELRFDDIYVKNATQHGFYAELDTNIHGARYINDVTAIGNGDTGVYIAATQTHWQNPIFRRWHVVNNSISGIHFINFICATMYDCNITNVDANQDYFCENTNLWVFRGEHRKARARSTGSRYYVISWRYLNFEVVWQNGEPCRGNYVEFDDDSGNRWFRSTTDNDGKLGNFTEWEWSVGETRTNQRWSIIAYLAGSEAGTQRIPGPSIPFDKDYKGQLVFNDVIPPDLVVTKPSSNHVQSKANLTVEGKCTDAHSGPWLVQVSFDPEPNWNRKSWHNASGSVQWDASFDPWPDGTYTVFVRAFDLANHPTGLFSNITITNVTVDTTAPNLTVRPLVDYTITNNSFITVSGHTDPDVTSISINGEVQNLSGSSFSRSVVLNEGNNTIVVVATDWAGNIAKETRVVRYDSISPILIITHPPPGLRTNQQTLSIAGRTDLVDVQITVDGIPVQIMNSVWSHTVGMLPGPNSFLVDAVDSAFNHRKALVEVYYDNVPPDIQVSKPQDGEIINVSTFKLLGFTATDIRHNQIEVNEIFIGVDNGVFDYDMTILEDGPLNITIVAEDIAGNVATEVIQVIIDTTGPTIQNLSLIEDEILNVPTITITGNTETDSTLYIEGKVVQVIDGFFHTQVGLEEGPNTIQFRAQDAAGNVRVINRRVYLDTIPPVFQLKDIIGNQTTVKKNFITIRGSTEANVRLTFRVMDRVEEGFVDAAGEFSHPLILGKNKTTVVTIRVKDYAGNVFEQDLTVLQEEEEAPPFYEEHSTLLIGIGILALAIFVAFLLTMFMMNQTYKRRLSIMGLKGAPQPPQEPVAPAPPQEPVPPSEWPQQRAPPRPPTEEEQMGREAPRPPEPGE
jgi:hypothetical protein